MTRVKLCIYSSYRLTAALMAKITKFYILSAFSVRVPTSKFRNENSP